MNRPACARQEAKDQKLRELVLYVAQRSQGDATFGAAKQNKLLLYADFFAYVNFGQPITHQEYGRAPNGPTPKRWPLIKKKMLAKRDIAIQKHRTVALRKPNLSVFSTRQIRLVDQLIAVHRTNTAAGIIGGSHVLAWTPAISSNS